jgi:membrane associated rhomboid family serine protease
MGAVTMGGVAWWTHIGGFVFGLVMVRRFLFLSVPRPQSNYFYQTIEPPSNERARW